MENLGMVTIDVVKFETLVRENEKLKQDIDRLTSLLLSSEQRIRDCDIKYTELLDRIARTH